VGNPGSDVAELITLALVIAFSPFSIIPGILVLHTPRPRPTSMAFLAGWVLGIAVVTAGFVGASDLTAAAGNSPQWTAYVRIAIGIGLIAWGLYRWLTRNRPAAAPGWMTSLTSIGPGRAFITAAVLTVANPKVLFMCAAAGAVIGTANLGATQTWASVAVFTAIAVSSVALPVLGCLVAGPRLDEPLDRLKNWMEKNHAALIGAILILIGLVVAYKGIHAL
jgi:threonine/homoserine/homoserine lactone efflux protein